MPWPKGKPRGPRNTAVRQPVNNPVQEVVHEPIRAGAVQAVGRDGEVLTRKRTMTDDIFHIPREIVPEGWDYQWNPYEVVGKPFSAIEANMVLSLHENGWRPVPCGRHPGRYMPAGTPPNSPIIRDGLVLEERPMELTLEAKHEEEVKAQALVRDQQEQLGLSQKMPDGFSRDNSKLRQMERAQTRRTYEPAPDVPRPRLQIDPGN